MKSKRTQGNLTLSNNSLDMYPSRQLNKVSFWGPTFILVYLVTTAAFSMTIPGTLLSDLFVAPLFFIIPIGIGLIALAGSSNSGLNPILTRAQQIVFAFLIGSVFFTFVFIVRENYGLWRIPSKVIFLLATVFSLLGYYKATNLFVWDKSLKWEALMFLSGFPFLLVSYLIKFYFFSDYPFTDIFQEVHFLKGATEFARFDILNRSTTASYIPILQVLNGVLVNVYSYDLLRAQWLFPISAALFNLLSIYAAISSIVEERSTRWIAWLIAVVLLADVHLTNGNIARNGSLILLSLLVNFAKNETNKKKAVILVFLAAAALYGGRKLLGFEGFFLVPLIAIFPLSMYFLKRMPRSICLIFLSTLLTLILNPVHRSVILFVPGVVGIFVLLLLVQNLSFLKKYSQKLFVFLYIVPIPLIITGTFGAIIIFGALHDQTVVGPFMFKRFVNLILKLFLNQDIDLGGEIALGAGLRLAAFEFGRMLTPMMAILLSFGICLFWYFQFRLQRQMRMGYTPGNWLFQSQDEKLLTQMIWLLTGLSILVFLILIGIPFVYRVSFLPVLLGAVIAANLIHYFYLKFETESLRAKGIVLFALAILAYVLISGLVLYKFGLNVDATQHEYLKWFRPVALTFYILITAITLLVCGNFRRSQLIAVLSVVCLAVALYADKQLIRVRFMDFSYGSHIPSGVKLITHYSRHEIELAYRLKSLPQKTILISDPYTISILRALTGLNAPFSYSNLDTMNLEYKTLLTNSFDSEIGEYKKIYKGAKLCLDLKNMLSFGSGELNYAFLHTIAQENSKTMNSLIPEELSEAISGKIDGQGWIEDAFFKANDSKWKIIFVVGEKTLAWADSALMQRVDYYPMKGKISSDLIHRFGQNHKILYNIDDRIVAFEVNCRS